MLVINEILEVFGHWQLKAFTTPRITFFNLCLTKEQFLSVALFRLLLTLNITKIITINYNYYFHCPKSYNSLNSTITGSSSSASFKRKLKEFLLSTC